MKGFTPLKGFKYIENFADGGEGVIHLKDPIGTVVDECGNLCYGISGSSFAYEMDYLQKVCSNITIKINSGGGSVLDGYSIISSILNCKVPCNTVIEGLAASIAAVIAVAGKKCFITDYGTFMIHSVSGGDGDKKILDIFESTLVTILTARCNKTAEEVADMMKKETWMKPAEALAAGFVDEILPTDKKFKAAKKTTNVYELANIYNSLTTKKPMKKTTTLLNIAEDSSDDLISSKIEELKNKATADAAELATTKTKLAALEAKEVENKTAAETKLKADATEVVNKAVTDKKITSEEAAEYINKASTSESDLKFVKNTLDKIGGVKTAATRVDNIVGNDKKVTVAGREAWTIRDWEKKDPKGLKDMLDNDKPAYDALYNAYYKKK